MKRCPAPDCGVPHRAETDLCPFCEVTRVHAEGEAQCKAFATAMVVVGLAASFGEADEYGARMERERNEALGWPAPVAA